VDLENKNTPKHSPLSEEDAVTADGFIEDILLLLPFVGVLHGAIGESLSEADEPESLAAETSAEAVPTAYFGPTQPGDYTMKVAGGTATLSKTGDGVLVHKGSRAVLKTATRFAKWRRIDAGDRNDLIESGVLAPNGDHRVFTKDHRFDSMGKAASVIRGSNTGADVWTAAEATSDE
jgi:hypothetical protein